VLIFQQIKSFCMPFPVTDKSQQMSDWTVRPLSQQQMHYAALDAYVLPQLFDKLCSELGEQRSQQLLKQHTTSVRRVSAASDEQQQLQQQSVESYKQERCAQPAVKRKQQQQQQQQQQQDNPHKRHAGADSVHDSF
jgi:ribonuclease D